MYALNIQRDAQKKLPDELFTNIAKQIMPASIEDKIELYKKRIELEKEGKEYDIIRESFLNYRLLRSYIKANNKIIHSYPLFYSYIKRKKAKLKIKTKIKEVFISNRENVNIIELSHFNKLLKTNYKSVKELIYTPISVKEEINLRNMLIDSFYSLSPIIVVDRVDFESFELFLDAVYYQDIIENLVIF
jgi:hypothetical protein